MSATNSSIVFVAVIMGVLAWIIVRVRRPRVASSAVSHTKKKNLAPMMFFFLGMIFIGLGIQERRTGTIGRAKGGPVFWWQNVASGTLMVCAAIWAIASTHERNKKKA